MAPKKKRGSHKGWTRVGAYTTPAGAERKVKSLKARNKNTRTKTTERMGKVRVTLKGRRVLHPIDYPGGKKKKIYRVYAK